MKKMVILQNLPEYRGTIEKVAPHWEIVFTENKKMAKEHLSNAEIVVGWTNTARDLCLETNTNLKWVQAWSAGVDDMPLEMFQKLNIVLTNLGGVHARPVSESVFASMLALARNVPQSLAAQKKKMWTKSAFPEVTQDEIHGKVIGILGTGYIGQEIARIARGFSMRTLGYRRTEEQAPYFDAIYPYGKLHEMLGRCDYIVNILPLTKETRKIINKEAFASMRPNAKYFAFGRGETTDTQELINALESNKLGGAGLDVFEPEPLPSDSPLWTMENVLISPHISGMTPYYHHRGMELFLENLESYVAGKNPTKNLINLDDEY